MKVLLCASEGTPFIKTGGLADVIGALPGALKKNGVDVRVVLPYYQKIKQKNIGEYIGYSFVKIGYDREYVGVFHTKQDDIDYYFIDNNRFFDRDKLYGYDDDGVRFAFFQLAILEAIKVADFFPDVMHLNDWQTGLIPYILKANYGYDQRYRRIKTLFSIHNIQYQGQFSLDVFNQLDLPYSLSLEYNYGINFMKTSIMEANLMNTVSPTYRNEILTEQYGYGLDKVLEYRKGNLYGILNGLDVDKYDPKTDKYLYTNYSVKNYVSGKQANKKQLLEEFGLKDNGSILFGLVSRLADQKGIDLFYPIIDEIIRDNKVQFILLGSGDKNLEDFFLSLQDKYPDKFKCFIGYSDEKAQKIYAGSDVFLMPSKFEPCGLGQMIAMRYGTLPLVRETGGLKDTVIPYGNENAVGFTFKNFNSDELKEAMLLAIRTYQNDPEGFKKMIRTAMKEDFSWNRYALEYINLYQKMCKE